MKRFVPVILGLAILSGSAVLAAPVCKAHQKTPTAVKKQIKKAPSKSARKLVSKK